MSENTTAITAPPSPETQPKEAAPTSTPPAPEPAQGGWFTRLIAKEPAPKAEVKPEVKAEVKPESKPEVKLEVTAEVKPEIPPTEPVLSEGEAKLEKRLKDTRDALTQERQRAGQLAQSVAQLSDQMKTLMAKVDGTYEAEQVDPARIAAQATFAARVEASQEAAVVGLMAAQNLSRADAEAKIADLVWNPESPYQSLERSNQAVKERVMLSKVPVLEALRVLQERETATRYGETPEQVRAAIEKEVREKIAAETKEADKKEKKEYKPIAGVGGVRGTNGSAETPVKDIFPSLFPSFPKKNYEER